METQRRYSKQQNQQRKRKSALEAGTVVLFLGFPDAANNRSGEQRVHKSRAHISGLNPYSFRESCYRAKQNTAVTLR